jgi:ABC-type multidrug transport system permease subunit
MALGVAIALLFGYAFSWLMATIGLLAKTPEAAQSAGFLPIFPLVFASSVFVPPETMPGWLQGFAENQPISVVASTVRSLMISEQGLAPLGLDQGALILKSFAWIAVIIAVFAPLAVRQYRRSVG